MRYGTELRLPNDMKVRVLQVTLKKSSEDFAKVVGDQNTPVIVDVAALPLPV